MFKRILAWVISQKASNLQSIFRMTSLNGNIFRATGPLCAGNSPVTIEFPSQRPLTRSFEVCSVLCQNKRSSKQSRRRWFETPSRPLWRHCNVEAALINITQVISVIIYVSAVLMCTRCVLFLQFESWWSKGEPRILTRTRGCDRCAVSWNSCKVDIITLS